MTFQRKISCLIALLLHVPLIHGLEVGQTPHVAVVGGGWGGIGAVKSLLKNGCKVTLIDIVDPTGKIPYRTPSNKPFEPGTRGFWKDYPNIEELLRTVGLNEKCVFTPFTNSSFYSPYGLECTAPVFSDSNFPELPSPFGQIFASAQYFERLPLQDRASMAGLLLAVLDFNRNPEIFSAYDRMTAHELFIRFGISKRLVDDFLRPTLLVGLFKPPEELSAAVTLELLYFYALAHQTSFDVRWIKKGTIAEEIVQPVFSYLFKEYGGEKLTIYSGCQVESLYLDSNDNVSKLILLKRSSNTKFEIEGVDGCVLAVGSKGMKAIISGSKELALQCPELSKAASLGAIDVISIRIWMDCYLSSRSPVNVLSRFEELRGAGGTFFFLDQLQKENEQELWGTESPKGSVLACDFYNAGSLQVLSDDALVSLLVKTLLPSLYLKFPRQMCLTTLFKDIHKLSPGFLQGLLL